MIKAVGVVLPVHNEEALLAPCLEALAAACAELSPSVHTRIIVVLDSCTDRSAEVAMRVLPRSSTILQVQHRNVGRSRHSGVATAIELLRAFDPSAVWLATTDADSKVPREWLREQVALADSGVDAVAGTIRIVDWEGYSADRACDFERFYAPGGCSDAHEHVHATNLGVRADAYKNAGGFSPVETGEDHALWNALRLAGRTMVSTRRFPVVTSARLEGRAPRGFAAFLNNFRSFRAS